MGEKCPICGTEIHDDTVACPGCCMDVSKWRVENRLDQLEEGDRGYKRELDRLRAENRRLQAIVDKLPKTADGVPVTPGMRVWFWANFPVWGSDGRRDDLRLAHDLYSEVPKGSRCYSTSIAAEAAKEK